MKRKLTLDVKTHKEFFAIERALQKPDVRAFVLIMGLLEPFTERQQRRILTFVADEFDERDAAGK